MYNLLIHEVCTLMVIISCLLTEAIHYLVEKVAKSKVKPEEKNGAKNDSERESIIQC